MAKLRGFLQGRSSSGKLNDQIYVHGVPVIVKAPQKPRIIPNCQKLISMLYKH